MDIISSRKPYNPWPVRAKLLILAFIIIGLFCAFRILTENKRHKIVELPFHEGQIVTRVLGNTKVQIISVDPFDSKTPYRVRLLNGEVYWVRPYEIEP